MLSSRFFFFRIVVAAALVAAGGWIAFGARPHLATAAASMTTATAPPSFDSPSVRSISGHNVGLAGMYSMVHRDFNGDGVPDLATVGFGCALPSQGTAAIYLGNGDGTFGSPSYAPAGNCPIYIQTGRLRGNNAPDDLLVIDAQGSNLLLLLGNGDGTFQDPIAVGVTNAFAVAVADFNEDGKADLAVMTGGNTPVTILLGNGDGTFQPAQSYATTPLSFDVTPGKFTATGHVDLLVRALDGIYYSRGLGDGTFAPGVLVWEEPNTLVAVTPPGHVLNGPQSVVLGDFNKDGNLDFAVDVAGNRVDIVLGTGTGVFIPAPVPTYSISANQTGFGGGGIETADLRGTGNLDLVIATGYGATAVVMNGNGDGTFQGPLIYPLPEYDDETLAVADFNRDGRPDIVCGTAGGAQLAASNFLTVMLNKGDGFGAPPAQFATTSPADQGFAVNPIGVALGDLSSDGKLDLVVTLWGSRVGPVIDGKIPNPPHVNTTTEQVSSQDAIAVMPGNGDGTFQAPHYYLVGTRPLTVRIQDLTGDGKKDVVVTNAISNTVSILKGNGDGTLQAAIDLPAGSAPNMLVVADLNGDGKPDIAATNNGDQTVSVFMNRSTAGQISFASQVTYPVGLAPAGIVAGDINHDGKRDLVVLNNGDPYTFTSPTTISVLLNNGDGTFTVKPPQKVWNVNGGDAIAIGDFSGTGRLDLAVANFGYVGTNELRILRNNGDGTFQVGEGYRVGEGAEDIRVADFNGDGVLDLAVDNLNDNTITMLVGRGDGTFVSTADLVNDTPVPFGWPAFAYPTFLDVGDIDGDGKPEIVTGNIFNRTVTMLHNTTPAVFDRAKLLKIAGLTHAGDGRVTLQGRGLANRTIGIEVAPDLNASFENIGFVEVDGSGTFEFDDSAAAGYSRRFYRLRSP